MFVHIAIFKWHEGVTLAEVNDSLEMVRQVADRVPGVSAIYCGENYSKWNEGYTHGVVVLAESQAAMDVYRADELHCKAAKLIDEMEFQGIGFDFADPAPR